MRHVRAAVLMTMAVVATACEKKAVEAPRAAPPAAAATPAGDTILIGHVGSLTGSEASFGTSTENGIRLAIEDINAKGGIKGKRVAVKTYDDQGKPEEAAVAATRLITQDKVTVLIGEVASSRSLAMAPIADANQVPQISPTSTNPRVTKDGDKTRPYVFRVCFIDPFQGTVMAKFARENLKLKRVAILRDVGSDYSVGLADYFKKKFEELGGTIVNDQSFKSGDQDFKAQLTTIKGKTPEMIYVPGYYTDVALVARQARELGIKVPLGGGDGWDSSKLYEIAQGRARRLLLLQPLHRREPRSAHPELREALPREVRRHPRLDGGAGLRRRPRGLRRHGARPRPLRPGGGAPPSPPPGTSRGWAGPSPSTPTTTP